MSKQVDLIIINGIIITCNPHNEIITNGKIVIDGGNILEINSDNNFSPHYEPKKVIDASEKIVMPGLVCGHTHMYSQLMRGAPLEFDKAPSNFSTNLHKIWWYLDSHLNYEDAYASTLEACYEMIRYGTTTFADTWSAPSAIDGVLDEIEKAVIESGLRGIIAFEPTQRNSTEEGMRGLNENIRFIRKENKHQLVHGMHCLHASFTVTNQLIKDTVRAANEDHAPLSMHTSEGKVDLYHNYEHYGMRTVERLKATGMLDKNNQFPLVLVHCVNVNQDEIQLIAEEQASVITNSMSNMLNAVGIAPVHEMQQRGITVGIGNDGFVLDQFENLRNTFIAQKVKYSDPRVTNPTQMIRMATIDAAKAYGLQNVTGSLEQDKSADLIILDPPYSPTPITEKTVLGHLVFAGAGSWVETTIVNGDILMERKYVRTLDVLEVKRIAQEATMKLWERMNLPSP